MIPPETICLSCKLLSPGHDCCVHRILPTSFGELLPPNTISWKRGETICRDCKASNPDNTHCRHTMPLHDRPEGVLAWRVEQPRAVVNDPVNHPKHYTSHPSGIECIEITRHMGFNLGNAVKYIWRSGLKESLTQEESKAYTEDLRKAVWYIQDEIARVERERKNKGME